MEIILNERNILFKCQASILLVPGTGIEPVQSYAPRDFKSLASTSSAIPALFLSGILGGIMQPRQNIAYRTSNVKK